MKPSTLPSVAFAPSPPRRASRSAVLGGPFLALVASLAVGCSSAPSSTTQAGLAPGAGGDDAGSAASVGGGDDDAGVTLGTTTPPSGRDAGAAGGTGDSGATAPATDAGADASTTSPTLPGWTLTWNDEFNLANGSAVDSSKWTMETGNSGWSNNHEREYYTPGTDNAVIENGSLVITAKSQGASAYQCQYGTCEYTSSRLNTSGKFTQKYGRFESRIKLPSGQGVWPAFWVLGDNIGSAGWPTCGEIDIMENVGSTPSTNYGSLHGPGYSGGQDLTGSTTLKGGTLSGDFHVYAVEWSENLINFYFDGVNYETRTNADVPAGDVWVYDHPFFIILNFAVGGYWPGDPDSTTTFPQTMQVDYVRVYSKSQ